MSAQESKTTADRPNTPRMTAQPGPDCRREPFVHDLWGFTPSILIELKRRFLPFLENVYKTNPLKGEYFLPFVVDELLQEKKAEVTVLRSYDNWYGVTYKEDKENVMAALQKLKDEGRYPQKLWEE